MFGQLSKMRSSLLVLQVVKLMSLNHLMCSENPQKYAYLTLEPTDFRFAATAAQKNYGTHYLRHTLKRLKIHCGENLHKFIKYSKRILLKKKRYF